MNRLPRNRRWISSLLAAGLLGLSAAAVAQDYYVDARTGNDANDGSEQHPFRTLAPLLARLTPCDNAFLKIEGAANGNGVGRYSHLPGPGACMPPTQKS